MTEYFLEPKSFGWRVKVELNLPNYAANAAGVVVKDDVIKDLYHAKMKNIEDKIPDSTNLATNTTINGKIKEVKNEISSINNVATTTALTAAENKIPIVSKLFKKKKKLTITQKLMKLNKVTSVNFAARLAEVNLESKSDIHNFVRKQVFMIN